MAAPFAPDDEMQAVTAADLFITIHTARAQYALRRDQISELRRISDPADLERPDHRGKPISACELGPLLDPADVHPQACRHALIVPTRRRGLALLVARIEDLYGGQATSFHPLPPLLASHLAEAWYLGVVLRDTQPLLLLDLRQLARSVLLRDAQARQSCSPAKVSVSDEGETYGTDSDANA